MFHLDANKLKKMMYNFLISKGVCHDSAFHVSESLIQTSLRGVDSHGVNLFPHYCNVIDTGRINKNPIFNIDKKSSGTIILDADHGFGHHAGAEGMKNAVELAKNSGIGAVVVKNSSHFGAAAYFGLMAPNFNCLGFSFTNADALVKAHGSSEAFFGTNPICFTAPLEREEPYCLDMATSQVSFNKIKNYRRTNTPIPENWGFDESGKVTTNPHDVRSLFPAGEYKGYGLGMMVEILCGVLAGGPCGPNILAMYTELSKKRYLSQFFMAIDISKFIDISSFKKNLQDMVDSIRKMPRLTPEKQVMVAGDPEKICKNIRIQEGIPIDEIVMKEFEKLSSEFKSTLIS